VHLDPAKKDAAMMGMIGVGEVGEDFSGWGAEGVEIAGRVEGIFFIVGFLELVEEDVVVVGFDGDGLVVAIDGK